jgi:nitrite reductase (NADH) small subunit
VSEHHLGASDDVPEGGWRILDLGEVEVGVVRAAGRLYAYENRCPHQGGPVCYGVAVSRHEVVLDGGRRVVEERLDPGCLHLICPWHGYAFDAATGVCVVDPRLRLRAWDLVERDGQVFVREPQRL